jgi:hypothetical protein
VKALVRAAALTGACLGATGASADADVIITPFVGKTFAARHTLSTSSGLPVTASVDKQTWIIGGSAAWLSDNVLGVEVDFGYAPRFFESNRLSSFNVVRPGSNVMSLTGNLVLALPLSVTRDSLRPYVSAGMGVLHVGVDDLGSLSTVDRNLVGLSVGGGAIGFLTDRTGLRFDLRYLRSTSTGVESSTLQTVPRLGLWRATIGVAIRY